MFESGSYTVVLARDASVEAIVAALEHVPPTKRPAVHEELLTHYLRWYPGWALALCCTLGPDSGRLFCGSWGS